MGRQAVTALAESAVCPETLVGRMVEMEPDGEGGFYCNRCGADPAIVRQTAALVAADWTAGGPGYRKPLPGEITSHWPPEEPWRIGSGLAQSQMEVARLKAEIANRPRGFRAVIAAFHKNRERL